MVQVGCCPILLVNDGGQFYALQGFCRHQNLPLVGGVVWNGVLDCPWHHFQYDIRTGKNLYPQCVYPVNAIPRLQNQLRPLQTYPVQVEDKTVRVGVPADCQSG
jgi:nitrite reductase/ring-hydroxylating ferredoxin subunit